MKTHLLCCMFIASCMILSGCEDKTSGVIGAWKTEEEIYHGTYSKNSTLVIEKDSISFDGDKKMPIELKYEEANGDILLLRKNDKWKIHNITLLDKDRIQLTEGGNGNYVFIRTTPEDVDAIVKSEGTKSEGKDWFSYRKPATTDKP